MLAAIAVGISHLFPLPYATVDSSIPGGVATRVLNDFQDDQAKIRDARTEARSDLASGALVGSALLDFQSSVSLSGPVRETSRTSATELRRAPDPRDSSLDLEVHVKGDLQRTRTDILGQPKPTESLRFDDRYWMREAGGHYAIADSQVSEEAAGSSGLPSPLSSYGLSILLALFAAIVVLVALTLRRVRALTPSPVMIAAAASTLTVMTGATSPTQVLQGKLKVQSIGAVHLWDGDKDLAPDLLLREVHAFIWFYLLCRLASGLAEVTRLLLGEEAYPGHDLTTRKKRTRDRLGEMRRDLPPALRDPLFDDGRVVRLDLPPPSFDVLLLRQTAVACKEAGGILSEAMHSQARAVLGISRGEFLPMWEEIAEITEGRGSSLELICEVRELVRVARTDVLLAVGETLLARNDAAGAVAVLEEALQLSPERQAVALQLTRALAEHGEPARSADIRREYGLSE